MNNGSDFSLRAVRFLAIAVTVLMVVGIVTIMFLARGTGEDITGVVAPALLITVLSIVVVIVTSVMQRGGRASRPE